MYTDIICIYIYRYTCTSMYIELHVILTPKAVQNSTLPFRHPGLAKRPGQAGCGDVFRLRDGNSLPEAFHAVPFEIS